MKCRICGNPAIGVLISGLHVAWCCGKRECKQKLEKVLWQERLEGVKKVVAKLKD